MNVLVQKVISLAIILVASGCMCDALRCYYCLGDSTSECADPFNPSAPGVNITENVPGVHPLKPCQSCLNVSAEKDGLKEYLRSCMENKQEDKCQPSTDMTACTCNKDLCNSATVNIPSIWVVLFMTWIMAGAILFMN